MYGSLALTGKGHGTENVLRDVLGEKMTIVCDIKREVPHPNTLDVIARKDGQEMLLRGYSLGGRKIKIEGEDEKSAEVYPFSTFSELKNILRGRGIRICDYAFEREEKLHNYLILVWEMMQSCAEKGLARDGVLPGGLNLPRKARELYLRVDAAESESERMRRLIYAYSLAVAEENASNGNVVTAPTCGSSGVVPGLLLYLSREKGVSDASIIRALATAGMIGNIVKENASLSGAECGCQAEIGTACLMAAAAMAEIYELNADQIECAAEIAMEHNLGLTCDPVNGLVQVPCMPWQPCAR